MTHRVGWSVGHWAATKAEHSAAQMVELMAVSWDDKKADPMVA